MIFILKYSSKYLVSMQQSSGDEILLSCCTCLTLILLKVPLELGSLPTYMYSSTELSLIVVYVSRVYIVKSAQVSVCKLFVQYNIICLHANTATNSGHELWNDLGWL